jgi:hypothetical protein
MNRRNFFGLLFTIPIVLIASKGVCQMATNWGSSKDDLTIDNPFWNLVHINPKGITVNWQEKYGSLKTENCIGIWENKTEYMLTWKDSKKVFIEKNNLNDIEYLDLQ